ncbi:glutathione S-transferase N-terminal domain-containing protein [Psychromarinibacter sp. C21-152]|uniref:Glutathione S-transferase N-terminal domain-containing protein n=1 Tax=Psychromarinibacter sediminicola TaxID=3033385 RepID=A0AAE3T7I7_9RHOB|nr:glutathione S-transferase N-terminal domain-containing protein [Psychromarinibacter sediminicola]MDF0600365.1 glutathione S-transferase N-terminal domain-containing protein [Psychromarinibacter sediminicola]
MIDLYTWTTPNGRKASIMLEELGVPYTVHEVNIGKDEQFAADFLAVSPNNKIPAIVDCDTGLSLMESGAILLYLAETHGRLLEDGGEKWRVIEWLMWQMGGLGPMVGQAHHFLFNNPGKAPYAEERYRKETRRLYEVMNTRLGGRDYLAGIGRGSYSIADIASWPWVSRFERHQVDLADFPAVRDWYLRIAERPAVQRGYDVPSRGEAVPMP